MTSSFEYKIKTKSMKHRHNTECMCVNCISHLKSAAADKNERLK